MHRLHLELLVCDVAVCGTFDPACLPTRPLVPCSGAGGSVVGVVGASHLSGMQRLWDSGGWRQMVAGGLLEAPRGPPVPESPDATGVR